VQLPRPDPLGHTGGRTRDSNDQDRMHSTPRVSMETRKRRPQAGPRYFPLAPFTRSAGDNAAALRVPP
jgi:hypothetical protein